MGRSLGFIPCDCCKHCLTGSKEAKKTTHFCSFCPFFLVESKHLGATAFKAFQRPQTPFGDKLILLKLSETLKTPKRRAHRSQHLFLTRFCGSPLRATPTEVAGPPPGGFCTPRCQQLAHSCPSAWPGPHPHPQIPRPTVAPAPLFPSMPTLAFSKGSFKKRENTYFHVKSSFMTLLVARC